MPMTNQISRDELRGAIADKLSAHFGVTAENATDEQVFQAAAIVIREIPFGLNKSSLVEKIAGLVNDHKIDGISDLRDESDRKGIRVVIDLKRGTIPDIVINSLYKYTPLETSFGINMLAVVDNRPVLLNLKTALSCFVDHRREVVIRRTRYDLQKAEARAHILEGLRIAIDHIDEVVALIRASASPDEARAGLMQRFELTEVQARAILDMRLQRLTGLQRGVPHGRNVQLGALGGLLGSQAGDGQNGALGGLHNGFVSSLNAHLQGVGQVFGAGLILALQGLGEATEQQAGNNAGVAAGAAQHGGSSGLAGFGHGAGVGQSLQFAAGGADGHAHVCAGVAIGHRENVQLVHTDTLVGNVVGAGKNGVAQGLASNHVFITPHVFC